MTALKANVNKKKIRENVTHISLPFLFYSLLILFHYLIFTTSSLNLLITQMLLNLDDLVTIYLLNLTLTYRFLKPLVVL